MIIDAILAGISLASALVAFSLCVAAFITWGLDWCEHCCIRIAKRRGDRT